MKYRKKPVIVEAWKLDRNDAMPDFILNAVNDNTIIIRTDKKSSSPFDHSYTKLWYEIKTLEGPMIANEGDYIIQVVNGEYYPCKPDIFEKTYEKIVEGLAETIVPESKIDTFKKAERHWYEDSTFSICEKCNRYKECNRMNIECQYGKVRYY